MAKKPNKPEEPQSGGFKVTWPLVALVLIVCGFVLVASLMPIAGLQTAATTALAILVAIGGRRA